jgi:acetyl esterase/lipase
MSWVLFGLSLWGLLFTLNARWPSRNRFVLAPSFFAAWLTIELAGWHLLVQVVVTAVLCAFGALDAWPGWVGLALCIVSWAGLAAMVVQGRRSTAAMRDAIVEVVGTQPGPRVPFSKTLLPFAVHRRGVTRVKNIEFARAGGRRLRLDVTSPRGARPGERRPAILQIHGGAWVFGDKREQGLPLVEHLAANGWVAFNANYRLSPFATWPDHLVDCKRALAWIRAHAEEYGVDPGFVCVTGGSAGGHLAALVALTQNEAAYQPGFEDADTSVQAAVPFYGVYDFTNRQGAMHEKFLPMFLEPWVMKRFYDEDPEAFAAASPIDAVNAGAPPMLVIHGDRDTLAPVVDARLFVDRLRDVSPQPVLYGELAGAEHAFDVFCSIRAVRVIEAVERFLHWAHERHLRPEDQPPGAHDADLTPDTDTADAPDTAL